MNETGDTPEFEWIFDDSRDECPECEYCRGYKHRLEVWRKFYPLPKLDIGWDIENPPLANGDET